MVRANVWVGKTAWFVAEIERNLAEDELTPGKRSLIMANGSVVHEKSSGEAPDGTAEAAVLPGLRRI